jgi:hypothetical protein
MAAGHVSSRWTASGRTIIKEEEAAKVCLEPVDRFSPSTRREGGTMPVPDPNSPQVLTTALTEQEATLIVNHLDGLGIKADIWGVRGLAAWPDVPRDIRVVVRQADLSQAKEALDRIRQ